MPNVNKVIYNNQTLIDLTEDTVTSGALVSGVTAHDASGTPIVGSITIPTKTSDLTNDGDDGVHPFLSQHQSLSAYRTASAQDVIDATKQPKLTAGSNIEISEALPSGYTKLEYIESSGTQYIDTGWVYSASKLPLVIDCAFATAQNIAESVIYGLQDYGYANWIYPLYAPSSDGGMFSYIGNATYRSWFTASVGTKYTTKVELSNSMITRTVNGSTDSSYYTPTISTTAHMLLFAGSIGESNPTNFCNAKIYSFSISENGIKTVNYIPAKNSSNVVGMYDTVTQTFFTNAGTGEFVAGQEVANAEVISAIVPTKTSELTNDSGFLTEHQSLANYDTKAEVNAKISTATNDMATKTWVEGKGYGTYSKPSGGIPSTDMTSEVQTSLGKADTALQEHQSLSAYRTASAQDTIDTAMQSDIDAIEGKIPAQATSSNQLADKDFVNSSIATETAHYISNNGQPFNSVAELEAYTGTVTNNDYAFVTGTDEQGNSYYDRYKASVSGSTITWAKEYRLNNSSFTAQQWASISSGITASDKIKLDGIEAGADVTDSANVLTAGATMGVKVAGTELVKDSDGKVTIPKWEGNGNGLFNTNWYYSGLMWRGEAVRVGIRPVTNANIDARIINGYPYWGAICTDNYDYAVRNAIASEIGSGNASKNLAYTDTEKQNVWTRFSIIKTTMDSVAVAGAQYYLGEQTTVAFTLPATANAGQQITVVFYSGATATTLTLSGTYLGTLPTPSANQRVELNLLYDGTNWCLLSNVMEVE